MNCKKSKKADHTASLFFFTLQLPPLHTLDEIHAL